MSELAEVDRLEKGVSLCLKNAKQYIKDADLLFSFKSYRHALALTILSEVELGKVVIYHLLFKDLISQDTLPLPFNRYLREKQYRLLVSETWWVGLLIASNVEYLVQNLLDIGEIEKVGANGELSAFAQRRIAELVEKMNGENSKLKEYEEYREEGFFVDFKTTEGDTFSLIEKTLVREQINEAKQRIKISQPFLSLSLTESPRKIAKHLLREAFQSILPLRSRIRHFTFPLRSLSGNVAYGPEEQLEVKT